MAMGINEINYSRFQIEYIIGGVRNE